MRKHLRGWLVPIVAVVALVPMGIAFGLTRATNVPGTRASCLDWVTRTSPVTTTSTTWTNVPGVVAKDFLAQNFTVQVSGSFDGSDIQLRVMDTSIGGTSPLAPGWATFRVGSVPTSFSFTWVGTSPAEHQHSFQLQWRLPAAGSTSMSSGDLTVLYQGAPTPGKC